MPCYWQMNSRGFIRTLAIATFLAPSFAAAQTAWDGDIYSVLKARIAEAPAPSAPAAQAAPPAARDPDARARALFRHPLIIGASVSSGFRAETPARKIARQFGTNDAVVSLAVPGAAGAHQVEGLTDERLAAATVVVGIDLFFWDTQRDCAAGLAGVDELFKRVSPRKTPLIVATVPAMRVPLGIGGGGDCRDQINPKIAKSCNEDPECVLLDLNALYAKAAADGGADYDGKRVAFRDMLSDGLHLSDAGSQLVAQAILNAVRESRK
jgi:hypothetical protein